jgi:hypothetical protein
MSDSIGAALDPSVADYRATSPRCAQGGTRCGYRRHGAARSETAPR